MHRILHLLPTRMLAGLLMLCILTTSAFAAQDGEDVRQRELLQMIFDTEQSISAQQWLQAVEKFDAAWERACEREDPLLTGSGADADELAAGQTQRLAGGRARLEDLFLTAPDEFRSEHLRQFSQVAEARVSEAIAGADSSNLRHLALRYAFFPAAKSALRILARQSIDRGDDLEAALLLNLMLRVSGGKADSTDAAEVSLQIAICNWRAGLNQDALESVAALVAVEPQLEVLQKLPKPSSASTADLQDWLTKLTGVPAANATEWRQPGGNYRRFASRSRGPARLQPVWTSDALSVNDVLYSDRLNPVLQSMRDPMLKFNEIQEQRNGIVMPVASPLRVGELVIFRTLCGIRAVDASSGEIVWEVAHPDGRIRDLMQAAEDEAREKNEVTDSTEPDTPDEEEMPFSIDIPANAQSMYLAPSLRNQLVRTNTSAQFSASDTTLYVVEDASGATDDEPYRLMFRTTAISTPVNNFIRAYDLQTGLFKWEVGGQTQSSTQPAGKGNLLAGFYFLGAPLILGNRTYVLAENSEGLFLLQIAEPAAKSNATANPRVVRSQLLTQPQFDVSNHPVRKHAGLIPSYAHGMLICPTCDEKIVAVSAEDNAVRWVFRYANNIHTQELGGDAPVLSGASDPWDSGRVDLDSRWTDSLPRIVGDSIIVTPRDSDNLFCLDLKTGEERWVINRGEFHSIAAIVDDKLILCGNRTVQAFRLDNKELLWSQTISEGIICGHAATDGHILQIPTTLPAIVSLDVQTGHTLVTQKFTDSGAVAADQNESTIPGNLLIIGDQLLSQNLDSIRAYSNGHNSPNLAEQATERLLQNDVPSAIALLEQGLTSEPDHETSRELLIDVLMESLHTDFVAHRSEIKRLRELITEADNDRPVAAVLHMMLGMSLSDAANLPEKLNRRSQRQLAELSQLIARELSESDSNSVEELTDQLQSLLPELIAGQRDAIAIGPLRRLKSLTLVAGIRKALIRHSMQDRITIQSKLRDVSLRTLETVSDRGSRIQFVRDMSASGMPQLALEVLQAAATEDGDRLMSFTDRQIRFEIMRAGTGDSTVITTLLDDLMTSGDLQMLKTIHDEFKSNDSASPLNLLRLVTAQSMANKAAFEAWFESHPETIKPEASRWGAEAKIDQSDHRTVMSPRKLPNGIPNEAVPLYGSPGKFRGWSFAMLLREPTLAAYDQEGRIQWTLPVGGAVEQLSDPTHTDSYITVCGPMMLVNLKGLLFSLDTTDLIQRMDGNKQVTEPRVLWTRSLSSLAPDPESSEDGRNLDFTDRLTQFAPQLSGYYPVAPVTATAVAVIAEQRLFVFDSLTGRLLWQMDSLALDAKLLTTQDSVLILSRRTGRIEARNIIDGTQMKVAGLPEWWGDAIGNVGSSVYDFEMEPGEELLWRIALHGQSCVLFRLGTTKSALECRDLMTDTVTWSIDLPANSVFSNVTNDVVATLGEGSELKLIRIDTGQLLASHDVTPVPKPRELFLVQTMGNYVVLPEAVDDPSIDLDPVMQAMHVYGRMYCINGTSMELLWDEPLDHRFIRCASAQARVVLPNAPIMILLKRGGEVDGKSGVRQTHYGARIIDVRTGKDILNAADVGLTLNDHWLRIDEPKHQLELSFDSHIFTLDFSDAK